MFIFAVTHVTSEYKQNINITTLNTHATAQIPWPCHGMHCHWNSVTQCSMFWKTSWFTYIWSFVWPKYWQSIQQTAIRTWQTMVTLDLLGIFSNSQVKAFHESSSRRPPSWAANRKSHDQCDRSREFARLSKMADDPYMQCLLAAFVLLLHSSCSVGSDEHNVVYSSSRPCTYFGNIDEYMHSFNDFDNVNVFVNSVSGSGSINQTSLQSTVYTTNYNTVYTTQSTYNALLHIISSVIPTSMLWTRGSFH